ncbi:MAG TPA: glycerol-3-phosphate 1-O-acyltransferase PlsY [Firmicutes bacterium]|jgi:glycerol-3-phosphate acyltransferase PlsY|nr:glycerol-3-phosphate 1-O-acyltransferase PlsY [Bacillota bacterium]
MPIVFSILIGYLVGSIPFGLLLCRLFLGIDIREYGSGNIGATNVQRTTGIILGVSVLVLDLLKGFISAWIGFSLANETGAILASIAAIAGHNWSVYLKFGGGKGVATTAGVALFLFPKSYIILLPLWFIVVYLTKYVSLASIISAIAMPFAVIIFGYSLPYIIMSICAAIFAVYRHKSNIERLRAGTESKFNLRKR